MRKMSKSRIVVAFQPHRYSRTKALMDEFITSFNEADVLIVTEIYAASEDKIEGITGANLAEKIRASGHKNVFFAPTKEEAAEKILEIVKKGDVVVTLGAGDIYKIDERLKNAWSGKA
jgi:UDP-N-acetylmuramate--alanine ligase